MSRDDGSAAGTVILAFVLGAVTGAAVALLMAPVSGEQARRILGDRSS
jgi:gas vesicle protein